MPKNTKVKQITEEERLKISLDRELEQLQYCPPVFRQFAVGDSIRLGGLNNAVVIGTLFDSKILLVEYDVVDRGKPTGKRTSNYFFWYHAFPVSFGDTKFSAPFFRINFYNQTIDSLLFETYSNGIDFDVEYQRGYVWTESDKEYLLESIFAGRDIGKFVIVRRKFNPDITIPQDEILDGKQRLSTILAFYEGRLAYKGKYIFELSREDFNRFTGLPISVAYINEEEMNRKQIIEIFLALNSSGKVMDRTHLEKIKNQYLT